MLKRRQIPFLRDDKGASYVELALVMPILFSIAFGTVDIGRLYFMSQEVAGAADAGALYGVQNLADSAGIQAVVQADAPDATNVSASSTYGCECADGSSSSTSCTTVPSCSSNNVVYWVNVQATGTFTPLIPWPGIASSITVTNSAQMRTGSN